MTGTKKLRPGLQFYPDAADYDESMRDLRRRLGRAPTEDDIADDLAFGAALFADGPCVICGKTSVSGGAAWLPGNVDSLQEYALCREHADAWKADDDATIAAVDKGVAELRKGRQPRVGDVFDDDALGPIRVESIERGNAEVKALKPRRPRTPIEALMSNIFTMPAKSLVRRRRWPIDDPRLAALGVTS